MYRVLQFGMTPNYGGVEAFIMNVYRNIDRNKIQFDFWVNTDKKISYEDEIIQMGGRIIRQKYFSRKKLFKHYREIFSYFRNNRDVIAIHLHKAVIRDIDLLIIAWIVGIPVRILHSHISLNPYKMSKMERINKLIIPLLSTNLFACSGDAGKYMFADEKFEIIRDGVDVNKYVFNKEDRIELRKTLNLGNDIFVGSIGRFCEQKNTEFIIDIFSEIHKRQSGAKLLLIGDGPLKQKINEKIAKYHLEDSVILPGELQDVFRYYSAMDVFLFPSRYEGFGMVLLEAQINGLKCVASKEGIPDLTNVTGRVEHLSLKETPQVWAEYILDSMPVERYDEVKHIRDSGFDIQQIADLMQKIYLGSENEK